MNEEQAQKFGRYLREHREAAGISIRSLAERIGVNPASILRFENGLVAFPRVDHLSAIATELRLPLADVLAMTDYPRPRPLPTIGPYLRSKYADLSPKALEEIEAIVSRDLHLPTTHGPVNGEDEH